ncbi:MAG: CheB methylesterase domain-containing protein [Archangium sp.]|nr:CheB methylesterase domain-containing protein [Archangium sp.]MDP3153529.1 CheB methylesterase domain-containing protein [Archangium sp.]MDP3574547.1 CheB methylesterase domain-containing protein [Archangium sp.]
MAKEPVTIVSLGRDAGPGAELLAQLERAGEVMVLGRASEAQAAIRMCRDRKPRCALLFVDSTVQLELLRAVLGAVNLPVVALSRTTTLGVEAMAAGASETLPASAAAGQVGTAVRLMAELQTVTRRRSPLPFSQPPLPPPTRPRAELDRRPLVLVTASTGGPPALVQLVGALGPDFAAPVLIVQHMPDDYDATFAAWLGAQLPLPVEVAQPGTTPQPGRVYLVRSGFNTVLGHGGFFLTRPRSPTGPCPSADVLFESVAALPDFEVCALVMTGMGTDGARGLLAIRKAGGYTLVQDKASCVIFGMPAEALRLGAAEFSLSPLSLAEQLRAWLKPLREHHPKRGPLAP